MTGKIRLIREKRCIYPLRIKKAPIGAFNLYGIEIRYFLVEATTFLTPIIFDTAFKTSAF